MFVTKVARVYLLVNLSDQVLKEPTCIDKAFRFINDFSFLSLFDELEHVVDCFHEAAHLLLKLLGFIFHFFQCRFDLLDHRLHHFWNLLNAVGNRLGDVISSENFLNVIEFLDVIDHFFWILIELLNLLCHEAEVLNHFQVLDLTVLHEVLLLLKKGRLVGAFCRA